MKEISDVSSKLEEDWKHASSSEKACEFENDQPFIEGRRSPKFSPLRRQVTKVLATKSNFESSYDFNLKTLSRYVLLKIHFSEE